MLIYQKSLLELVKETRFHNRGDKQSTVKAWIRHRLEKDMNSYRWNGWNHTSVRVTFQEDREISRKFGKALAYAFSADFEAYECVDLCNEYKFRRIRNRVALDSVLSRHFTRTSFYSCSDCGEILESGADNLYFAYHDNPVCGSCIDDNYRYSDYDDTFISEDDYNDRYNSDDDDDDEDDSLILQYHNSNPEHIPSDYDNRKPRVLMGLELECEMKDGVSREDKAHELLNAVGFYKNDSGKEYRYCELERDGSLSYGFEIVTGFTGLDVHRKQLEFFKNPWDGVKSHNTSTCGLHVHICKSSMTLYHAAKLVFFINDEKNHALIKALARRTASSYAQIKNKSNIVWLKNARECRNPLDNLNTDRYEALNFQNHKTIEFRLFKGTLKYETIQSCLEFAFLSWHFTRDASIQNLTIPKFLEFINKPENRNDSIYLREYLKSKGFDTFVANKKVA